MKQQIVRILNALVPQSIREQEQTEELDRARILVLILLIHLIAATIGLIGSFTLFEQSAPSILNNKTPLAMVLSEFGYALAVGTFWRTGQHVLTGNIFALTYYASLLLVVLTTSGQELIAGLLYLLALPLLVAFIGNYLSGVVWAVMVAIAPILLNRFNNAHLEPFFLGNWVTLCMCLFVAIHISHKYLKHLSQRLNTDCNRFEFAAAHDSLTGVANRATLERRLHESIEFCTSHNTKAVLVYIDLDKFKPINDIYGHQAGDTVLSTVADRLLHLVRRTDTVARLGGDEFALLFDQCNPDSIKPLIDRIAAVVSDPISVSGNSLSVGCSIGVAVCPDDGLDAKLLAHTADERMYEAKRKADASGTAPAQQR